jgi:hypothetical protein
VRRREECQDCLERRALQRRTLLIIPQTANRLATILQPMNGEEGSHEKWLQPT